MELFIPFTVQHNERVEKVIETWGNALETLRIDVEFSRDGEKQEGERGAAQRRHFICDIASRMRKIKTIKMEVSEIDTVDRRAWPADYSVGRIS
jgi:hypothetical protein